MNYTTQDPKGWFNLSPMLNTHRLHLSRYDTSPLLCLQPLLIMLLVFHGTLVWKHSSLLPRNVSFCWEQFHVHSTCTANQRQLVLEAESPPVQHHREKKRRISRWILCLMPDLFECTPSVSCQDSSADQKVSKASARHWRSELGLLMSVSCFQWIGSLK